MIHLVYVSSAKREMSEDELDELLKQSRKDNQAKNITGMLLYAGGNFFQILEGEEDDVVFLYNKITQDERHDGCLLLVQEEISARTFADWSMGFKILNKMDKSFIEGYTEFLDRKMQPSEFSAKGHDILVMLYQFRENNR